MRVLTSALKMPEPTPQQLWVALAGLGVGGQEQQVGVLLLLGLPRETVAKELGVTIRTVDQRWQGLCVRLRVQSIGPLVTMMKLAVHGPPAAAIIEPVLN